MNGNGNGSTVIVTLIPCEVQVESEFSKKLATPHDSGRAGGSDTRERPAGTGTKTRTAPDNKISAGIGASPSCQRSLTAGSSCSATWPVSHSHWGAYRISPGGRPSDRRCELVGHHRTVVASWMVPWTGLVLERHLEER